MYWRRSVFEVVVVVVIAAMLVGVGIFSYESQFSHNSNFTADLNWSEESVCAVSTTQRSFEKLTQEDFTGDNLYRNGVVRVITDLGYGSGFVISKNKVVTCAHCLQHSSKTYIPEFVIEFTYKTDQGDLLSGKYWCQLDNIDMEKDVAIGTILPNKWTDSNVQSFELNSLDHFGGQQIFFYGYQPGDDFVSWEGRTGNLHNTTTTTTGVVGEVSFKRVGMIRVEPRACPGNSGGPILCEGKVVGMVSGVSVENWTTSCVQAKDIISVLNKN